jgi:glycerophosphoryl diester phosphodiesterase
MKLHVILFAAVASAGAASPPAVPTLELQGHRGARGLAPENTLAAFARALAIGVNTLELDTAVTRDGVVVVSHDSALNPDITRDASGAWLSGQGPAIFSLAFADVRHYDVGRLRPGTPYAARFPDQVASDGQRIPTLAEVFALARDTTVGFNVETKLDPRHPEETPPPERFADAVIAVVRKEGMASRVTLQSFDWRTLRYARRVAPDIPTVCLTSQQPGDDNVEVGRPGASPWLGGLDVDDFGGSVPRVAKAAGCAVWSPNARDVTMSAITQAHAEGLRVIVWTVNDEKDMDALIDAGVDGVISDYPDRLRRVAGRRGLAPRGPSGVPGPR